MFGVDYGARMFVLRGFPTFTSGDPLGEDRRGLTPFSYAGNDPINLVDWMGLAPQKPEKEEVKESGAENDQAAAGAAVGADLQAQIDAVVDGAVEAVVNGLATAGQAVIDFVNPVGGIQSAAEKLESGGRLDGWDVAGVALDVAGFVPGIGAVGKVAKVAGKIDDVAGVAKGIGKAGDATRFISTTGGIVDIQPTMNRISTGGKFPHRNDGAVFMNKEGLLPKQNAGYYREFVHPTPGYKSPGPQRIVTGKGGEVWYTPDHYNTFVPVK